MATPDVTLVGEASDPASSRELLDDAAERTRELDRGKLSPGQAAVYDQINDIVSAGHDALTRRDYLAAASLARKASTLADQLPPEPGEQ